MASGKYAEEENGELRQDSRSRKNSGPRSPLVEAIAVMLLARPMRAAEIAQALGYPTRYVSSYLSYWKTRGLFEYVNGYWQLTPEGEDYAKQVLEKRLGSRTTHFIAIARQILEESIITTGKVEQVSEARKDKRVLAGTQGSTEFLPFIATIKRKTGNKQLKQLHPLHCLSSIIDIDALASEELEVLEVLVTHYMKWGTTYLYLDQLQGMLDADTLWLLRVLKSLQSKGLIYIYNDRKLGTRIGFSKKLRSQLQLCRG